MTRLLLIVARAEPARHAYVKHVFASDAVEEIVDRRVANRRQVQAKVSVDRRRADGRVRNITTELHTFGWALVRLSR